MPTRKYLYVFISLFFLLTFSKAEAFTQFNPNPNFTNTFTSYNIINSCQGHLVTSCQGLPFFDWLSCNIASWLAGGFVGNTQAYTISQNSSWFMPDADGNYSGFLQLDASTNCTWTGDTNDVTLYVQPRSDTSYQIAVNITSYSSLTNFNDSGSIFFLPKNQEGIIFLRFVVNDTTDFKSSESYLSWYDNLGNTNSTYLAGVMPLTNWSNHTLFIPADIYNDRNISIFLEIKYETVSNPISIKIDRFSFYTYDSIEPRTSYFTDFSTEQPYYCSGATTQLQFAKYNSSLRFAVMVANNTADNIMCCVYQVGNITISRRCTVQSDDTIRRLYISRDEAVFFSDYTPPLVFIVHNINTQSMTYSKNASCTSTAGYQNYFQFNGAGITDIFNQVGNTIFNCSLTQVFATWDLTNYNLSGTKFRIIGSGYAGTGYVPLFQYKSITTPSCTCTDNTQSCTDSLGLVVSTDCGSCGCDPANQYCNLPSIVNQYGYGTFCYKTINPISTNTIGYIYYNSSNCGSSGVYGECALDEYCNQTYTNAITCNLISNNTTTQYINSTGQNDTIPANPISNPTLSNNIFGYTAMAFGGLFGMSNISFLQINIAMFAIFVSFLFSGMVTMGLSFKGKAEFAEKIFGYSFLGLLAMFTIGFNNLYLWAIFAVIIIISAGIMSGYFKKVIGGD
jgi:hypothetical protein